MAAPSSPAPSAAPRTPAAAPAAAPASASPKPAAREAPVATAAPPAGGPVSVAVPSAAVAPRPMARVPVSAAEAFPDTVVQPLDARPAEPTKAWWVGTLKESPLYHATIGGVSFPRTSEIVSFDADGQTLRSARQGAIVHLTEAQVEHVLATMRCKVVRAVRGTDGTVRGGKVFDVRGGRTVKYVASRHDEPLARFVYMVRVPEYDEAPGE